MHMPPANRSMDVRDINGVLKNRYGARLSVDPEAAKQFAGTRRDSSKAVIKDQSSFIKHKNDSEAFSHLGNKQTLYRKSVQRLPNIEYHSVNRPSPARVNPQLMNIAGVAATREPGAMNTTMLYRVPESGNPTLHPKSK